MSFFHCIQRLFKKTIDPSNQTLSIDDNNIKEELLNKCLDVSNNSELIFEKDVDPLILKSKEVVVKMEKKKNFLNYFKKNIFNTCRGNQNVIQHSISQTKDVLNQVAKEVNTQIEEVNTQIEEVNTQIEEVNTQIEEIEPELKELLEVDSINPEMPSEILSESMENENTFKYHSETEFKIILDEFTKTISEREPDSEINQLLMELNKIMVENNDQSNESQNLGNNI